MSVDYTAKFCYGYLFSYEFIDYNDLDEKANHARKEDYDFDPYDMYFDINAYDEKTDAFIGITLAETSSGYGLFAPINVSKALDTPKNDETLDKVVKLFDLDVTRARNDKPQYYILCRCW